MKSANLWLPLNYVCLQYAIDATCKFMWKLISREVNVIQNWLKMMNISRKLKLYMDRPLHTFVDGISNSDPSSSKEILLYSLLADSRLCSITARCKIVDPKIYKFKQKHEPVYCIYWHTIYGYFHAVAIWTACGRVGDG